MTTFVEHASTLPPEDRDTLLGSIPLLIAVVVGADREFDEVEMGAAVDELLSTVTTLGDEFRHSEAAEREFDRLSARAREGEPELAGRLAELGRVVGELPVELRDRYRAFVKSMCLRLASASGGFFGFVDPISEDEKIMLHKIVAALGIGLTAVEKEALGFS
jgi:hypothetical protein